MKVIKPFLVIIVAGLVVSFLYIVLANKDIDKTNMEGSVKLPKISGQDYDYDYLESRISDLENQIESLQWEIDSIDSRTYDNESNIGDLESSVEDLEWRIDDNESNIDDNENDIDDLEDKIFNLEWELNY